jgi:hypothetical protein
MSRSTLRWAIIVLTLATVGIHWYLVPLQGIPAGIPFILNGLGYLVLMGTVLFKLPIISDFLAGRPGWAHYALIAFTVVTMLAWVAIGDKSFSTWLGQIGWVDKITEVLLIVAVWLHLRTPEA